MRTRSKIIGSLESIYTEAYRKADESGDRSRMEALDFGFQRDQVMLEVMLDLRDAVSGLRHDLSGLGGEDEKPESSLLDKAMAIRKFTKLRP